MDYSGWDTLLNMVLALVWFYAWAGESQVAAFNPYLAAPARWAGRAVEFLRPAFGPLPGRAVAAVALVFLIALRGVAAPQEPGSWIVNFGLDIRRPADAGIAAGAAFSALSFAAFVFKIWAVALLYLQASPGVPSLHTSGALYCFALPFTRIPAGLRPPALFAAGVALSLVLQAAGAPAPPKAMADLGLPAALAGADAPVAPAVLAARTALSALSAMVDALATLQLIMITLIIGSWMAAFAGSPGILFFTREWMDLFLGPLRSRPLRLGMLDLTALVFLLGVGFAHGLLQALLIRAWIRLL